MLLHPTPPHLVAGPIVLEERVLQLFGADLPQVPEDVRGEIPVGVLPDADGPDADAGETPGALLLQVGGHLLGDVLRDRHGLEGEVGRVLETIDQALGGDAQQHREPREEVLLVGHVAAVDGHLDGRPVVHEHVPVPVQDLAPRSRQRHEPNPVCLGALTVFVRGEHLEEPQPRGERGEQEGHHPGQDLDPSRHPALVHLTTGTPSSPASTRPPAAGSGRRWASARHCREPTAPPCVAGTPARSPVGRGGT